MLRRKQPDTNYFCTPIGVQACGNEKDEGGCAWWWGFHTHTSTQFFKSVFLNKITGCLNYVPLQSFLVKSKISQLHIIIYNTPHYQTCCHKFFHCCHIKRLNIKIPNFSQTRLFKSVFGNISFKIRSLFAHSQKLYLPLHKN